jgi:predicted amidophosphoribosyltransferase
MEYTNQTCNVCGKPVENNFCSNCGEPVQLRRVDGKYIADEIGRVINFERGFLYSIRKILIRPGKSVRAFLTQDRKRLVKPVVFVILCSLIYTLL